MNMVINSGVKGLRRKKVAPGHPPTIRHSVSAKIRGRTPVSEK